MNFKTSGCGPRLVEWLGPEDYFDAPLQIPYVFVERLKKIYILYALYVNNNKSIWVLCSQNLQKETFKVFQNGGGEGGGCSTTG